MAIDTNSATFGTTDMNRNTAVQQVDVNTTTPLGNDYALAQVVTAPGLPASKGIKAPSASMSVTQAGLEYETVAASQTAQVLGPAGATGDYLSHIIIVPATTSPGNVILLDNATAITIFTGGAGSVVALTPIIVPVGAFSVSGAWKLTTGANVSAIGVGDFT